jgi:hypothetical protein
MQVANIDRHFATDTSRDGCMRVPAAAGSSGAHAAAAAAVQERWHLQGLQQLPWDWSVKLRVRLSSTAPFAVLEEQRASGLGPGELLGEREANDLQAATPAVPASDDCVDACVAGMR